MTKSAAHILALHLTSPSSSEAKVLANLLRHKDDDLRVSLVVNARGAGDEAFQPSVSSTMILRSR